MSKPIECESAIELMAVIGGSFVRSLIVTYKLADPENRARIKAAFAREFQQYQDIYEDIRNEAKRKECAA